VHKLICFFLQYEVRGIDSSFFIDDSQVAEKLAGISKKITTVKGYKVCYVVFMDV
jgi:hypothetical protein